MHIAERREVRGLRRGVPRAVRGGVRAALHPVQGAAARRPRPPRQRRACRTG